MDSVTEENVEKIMAEKEKKLIELNTLKTTSEKQLWLNELDVLKKEYNKYITSIKPSDNTNESNQTVQKKKKLVKA